MSSSSYPCQRTPDVFVSFHDKDKVKEGFLLTLFAQLDKAGIGYFSHGEGEGVLHKIHQARFALVVLSANYAKSKRCLDGLVKILLRRGDSEYPGLVVIPIFHGMDPKLREEGEFKQALLEVDEKEKDERKKEWRRALKKVEGISGYESNNGANVKLELSRTIVKRLVNEIRSLYSHKVFGPFGSSGETCWHSDKKNGISVVYTEFVKSLTFNDLPDETSCQPKTTENTTENTYKVKLEEGEAITSFSGSFKMINHDDVRINSLTFKTNKRRLVPNITRKEERKRQVKKEEAGEKEKKGKGKMQDKAEEKKVDFFVPSDAGEVIEFFGRKSGDDFLTSIGARVKLTPAELTPAEPTRVETESCPPRLFGSRRGTKWDYERHTNVKRIVVVRDSSGNRCIQSISFPDGDKDKKRPPDVSDAERHEFIINGGDEYLSSISGCCTYDGITSLAFLTNKKSAKIIGDGKGAHFSSPPTGREIVGFYGWNDDEHLHGIGAYFKPNPDLPFKSFGPFGRAKAWDDGKFKGVKKIYIAVEDDDIRYIKIVYEGNDKKDNTAIHGDYIEKFNDEKEVLVNYPREYLMSISGYTREDGSIRSLIFDSNETRYGPYGKVEGECFWHPSNDTKIIGFYGTWGKTLDSIGVYAEQIQLHAVEDSFEPFEGYGGTKWDDGKHSNVIGYRVTDVYDSNEKLKIESITFMYEKNGSLVEGSRHGGGDAGTWVMLDIPKERLICITGYWRKEDRQTVIHNLKIHTSHRTKDHATYAAREGKLPDGSKPFSIPKRSEDRRIIGFFGKAHTCLSCIGAYFQPYDDDEMSPNS